MQSSNSPVASDGIRSEMRPSRPVGKIVDWLTAAFLVFGGLLFAALGAGLYSLADRDRIAEWVSDGTLTSTELSDAELVDVTLALFTWGGVGLAVTGLLMAGGGIAFLLYRRRMRDQQTAETAPDSVTLAIIGAVVTAVTSFVPFSPLIGGTVSGYLRGGNSEDGAKAGAYAGLVAAIPFALLSLFFLGGFVIAAAELGLGSVGVFSGLVFVFAILAGTVYLVGLSALGGYFGVWLARRERKSAA